MYEDVFIYARATGLEPATSSVTGRRSNQTELRPLYFEYAICVAYSRLMQDGTTTSPLHVESKEYPAHVTDHVHIWWLGWELNPLPVLYEGTALTT